MCVHLVGRRGEDDARKRIILVTVTFNTNMALYGNQNLELFTHPQWAAKMWFGA